MIRRPLRPGFVVTVSALALGCEKQPPVNPPEPVEHRNPPRLDPTETPTASATATAATTTATSDKIDFAAYKTMLNPQQSGRTVYFGKASCFVHRPDKNPPNAPPGMMATEQVKCPANMTAAGWGECEGGEVKAKDDGSDCLCMVMGNPPPPPRKIKCPPK
jgi:hypothetical protein